MDAVERLASGCWEIPANETVAKAPGLAAGFIGTRYQICLQLFGATLSSHVGGGGSDRRDGKAHSE